MREITRELVLRIYARGIPTRFHAFLSLFRSCDPLPTRTGKSFSRHARTFDVNLKLGRYYLDERTRGDVSGRIADNEPVKRGELFIIS